MPELDIDREVQRRLAALNTSNERMSLLGSVWNYFAGQETMGPTPLAKYDNSARQVHEFLCAVARGDEKAKRDCLVLELLGERGRCLHVWRTIYEFTEGRIK